MKKADFRKVEIENINGEKEIVDLRSDYINPI
jgi:hypothetical protein